VDEEEEEPAAKGKVKKRRGPKKQWTLPAATETDLIEWLRSNTYLWMRSSHDFKRKKEAWEMKASDLKITYTHLTKWWKNLKDWYVRLIKVASGQARKLQTERDKWVLTSLSFYKGQYRLHNLFIMTIYI